MDTRQAEYSSIFNRVRERLLERYAGRFNGVGADAEDALAKAFEYAVRWLLEHEGTFMERDVENLLTKKMNFLFKDALAAAKRGHGRRSVKTIAVLDEASDGSADFCVALIDRVSMARHFETCAKEGYENRFLLQSKAIACVLMRHGVSSRDRDIFDRCLFCAPDRKALAAELLTTVSNVGRIKCDCGKLAVEFASEIRSCYAALARQCEMAAC